jgi:formate dehydrogenase maturation protein FdhE
MSTERTPLGVCPSCGTELVAGMILIEYEKNGSKAVFAECPSCDEPVTPRSSPSTMTGSDADFEV